MDVRTYNSIVRIIRNHRGLSKDCLPPLKEQFPKKVINKDTLSSIIAHEYHKRMRCNHVKSSEFMHRCYTLYSEAVGRGDSPGIILKIAQQFDVTPSLVAKLILQNHLNDLQCTNQEESSSQLRIKSYLRDTSLIPDMNLAYEVYLCTLYDDQYSPIVETMKMSLGQEYEIKLYKEMARLGLAFRDEEHLRKYGYDKTPDVKLEVPVAVEGFVINWVESKALFGDEDVHKEYMRNQYLSYWNRFGPGLVIYWFGFVETVQVNDKRFIIRDHFPTKIMHIVSPNLSKTDSTDME